MSELTHLIRGDSSIDDITSYLEGLTSSARLGAVNDLRRDEQRRLFEKAADAPVIRLTHFVPESTADLSPVHHPGRNTVMTFTYFQRFQKRFARPAGERSRLFGYNESNASFIHPGYFVGYETDDREDWVSRGGVVIDYLLVPDAEVPDHWPKVVPNSRGLQRLVYHRTRDFMRRVASDVSIGRASTEDARGDRWLDYWFTLVRLDTPT